MNEYKYDFNFIMHLGATSVKVDIKSNASRVGLRAPSGSGKSSFVRTILGLNKKVTGKNIVLPYQIGYVPQDSLLIPNLNVKNNLLLSPHANKDELEQICDELSIGDLWQRYPRMLSGGEKQRVSIGRALLSQPKLLILDEPFAALDFEIRSKVAHFIKLEQEKKGMDLMLVTHDESSSNLLCDEFWTIKNNNMFITF
jgi:molybdate transport system ATP-binding protein